MRGWILDCYPDHRGNAMVVWLKTADGVERRVHPFSPSIHVWAPGRDLGELEGKLEKVDVHDTWREKRKVWLDGRERTTLGIRVGDYSRLADLARMIDGWGSYRDYRLFNVDLRFDQRYFLEQDVFPMGLVEAGEGYRNLDSPYRHSYPLPPLKVAELGVGVEPARGLPTPEDPIRSVALDGAVLEGEEAGILEDLQELLDREDPDVLLTRGGDDFHLHHLARRAQEMGMDLRLGRGEGERRGKEKSYFTYGRILYKPSACKLRGRIHIDRESSFMYSESGLYGLIDLSRLSRIPVQDLCRLSPGSAISAMQVNEAVRSGHLIMWKKNLPEGFKTARELMVSDRGGFIYEPQVGLHEEVAELDFASLYPNIMVRFNISPETVKCDCCPRSPHRVPEIGYPVCQRRRGLIPRVLEPVIGRRAACKRLMEEMPERREVYEQRARVLKWVLVTCFGYTGYRNARFGRIECHESITAYGREILLRAAEAAEWRGFQVLHGIVDSLWVSGGEGVEALCGEVEEDLDIPLELEGIYRWIVFLPCITTGVGALNRYYGLFHDGKVKARGIALRRHDTTDLVGEMQGEMLRLLSDAGDRDEFLETLPEVIRVMEDHAASLVRGEVSPGRLLVRKRISKPLEEYRQLNDSVAALSQFRSRGLSIPPGKSVRYLVLDRGSRDPWERVRVEQFMTGEEVYDPGYYTDLVIRATEELLSPFGYDFPSLKRLLDQTRK
ncbi:MAG: DNA polymerase domain-containing protein [Methanomassiliicoccales archaeon]